MTTRLDALDSLMATIFSHQTQGEHVPCVDQERGHLWLSEDRDAQEAAIHGCKACPALMACRRYVEEFPETAGTWAGKPNGRVGVLPEVLR
jgi:hypothetical protein